MDFRTRICYDLLIVQREGRHVKNMSIMRLTLCHPYGICFRRSIRATRFVPTGLGVTYSFANPVFSFSAGTVDKERF